MVSPPEVAWFSALCDDDYEFLGVPDPGLASSWEHCRVITLSAEASGYDSILLPSGYTLGIDSVAFAAAVATQTSRINLLLAVRMGELVVPQLARQLATIDQISGGRLVLNVISSDVPGASLPGPDRYRRTLEFMAALRSLMSGRPVEMSGQFVDLTIDPPRIASESRRCPPFYFGGLSEEAKACAAAGADVYLMWPDTPAGIASVTGDMRARADARAGPCVSGGGPMSSCGRPSRRPATRPAGCCPGSIPPPAGPSGTGRWMRRPPEWPARPTAG